MSLKITLHSKFMKKKKFNVFESPRSSYKVCVIKIIFVLL